LGIKPKDFVFLHPYKSGFHKLLSSVRVGTNTLQAARCADAPASGILYLISVPASIIRYAALPSLVPVIAAMHKWGVRHLVRESVLRKLGLLAERKAVAP